MFILAKIMESVEMNENVKSMEMRTFSPQAGNVALAQGFYHPEWSICEKARKQLRRGRF